MTRLDYAGEGALLARVERLRKALEAEGLFGEERKRPLPTFPRVIGVVTSAQGAVIQDIRTTLLRRFPSRILLWPVAVISVLLVFGYFFSTIANWIAAPFNGLLAEQLEARLTGATPPDTGVLGIMKDLPRIMKREWQKFAWYLPRAIVLLILYFVPGIGQTVAPVLWFLFSAWMLAIQYCDYPFDNHKVPFKEMRTALRSQKVANMQFGALTSLFTMIPFLNLFIMPVAVCGATAMWVDCYRAKHALWK